MVEMKGWMWGGLALWLVVVAAGSGLAWVAIDRAGKNVTAAAPFPPDTGATAIDSASPPSTIGSPSPAPSRTPKPSTKPSPSASAPAAPSAPSSTRPPAARFGTWSGAAGTVTVACTGSAGRLEGASPADGWRVERTDTGGDVRVKFERQENEVLVRASCSAAGPVFRVTSENDGGKGDD